ncbi:MAG: PASTA domain-containing protein, partial [Planctomycetes bacterium]|nr:PASTA domain-containing protein [Planctomycetota bacterium]
MGDYQNLANFANPRGMDTQVHVWPGFSWHNLQQFVFPYQYTDRGSGSFLWGKISNGIDIIDPDTIFVGMFDEYDEATAIMPMSDDPPVLTGEIGHYITNTNYYTSHTVPSDWWMTLSSYAKEVLCNQVPFSFTMPTEASLDNRSNIGQELSVDLGATNVSDLLVQEEPADGPTVSDVIDGVTCRRATGLYMYFDVDDATINEVAAGQDVTIIVDYYDTSDNVTIGIHYDSVPNQLQTHPKSFTTLGTNQWQTARFEIDDAYFGNRENGGDFRLRSNTVYNMNISRVRVVLEESSVYTATVPDVVGQAQATAESNIAAAGLVVGKVTAAYSSSVPVGEVIIQSPTSDLLVTVGSSVDLFVSTDTACAGPADFDCDGIVDAGDFSYMAGVWLTADSTADIAQPADGIVDLPDLLVLVQEWLDGSQAVAYWNFDETAGSVASDSSENGYDGALINMDNGDWVPGNTGNGLDFDGINDYVTAGNVCASLAGKDITVSAW